MMGLGELGAEFQRRFECFLQRAFPHSKRKNLPTTTEVEFMLRDQINNFPFHKLTDERPKLSI